MIFYIPCLDILLADIYPLTLLKESFRSEETEIRLRSIHRLLSVAVALGPEKSRQELLPFLLGK